MSEKKQASKTVRPPAVPRETAPQRKPPAVDPTAVKLTKREENAMLVMECETGYFNRLGYPKSVTYERLVERGLAQKVTVYELTAKGYEWSHSRTKAHFAKLDAEREAARPAEYKALDASLENEDYNNQFRQLMAILGLDMPGIDEPPASCADSELGKLTLRDNLLLAWQRTLSPELAEKILAVLDTVKRK